MATIASPQAVSFEVDRDQDLTVTITLPAGSYLSGGASGWALSFEVTHPSTGASIFSKTTGSGIVVTTAGSTTVDAVFTVTIDDTDIPTSLSGALAYKWKFKRTDAGSEVNIAAGTMSFPR